MNCAAVLIAGSVFVSGLASAQALNVQVQNGDVFFQDGGGVHRLTRDGKNTDAIQSRDGKLIAYVHKVGRNADAEEMNSLHLCNMILHTCEELVSPLAGKTPEENLTGIDGPLFSYQAGAGPSGVPVGSIFFQASAWATSGAVHRVTLGPNRRVSFVTDANGYSVVPVGKFAGALRVSQHRYLPQGGACERESIIDPNTGKQLQLFPVADC